MSFGGNNRAQIFFKQHGWTDGGKTEAKYTSRAAELYRQLLSKEVAKSMAEGAGSPSSPVASQSAHAVNGLPDVKISDTPKQSSLGKQETPDLVRSPKASHTVMTSSVKKPLGAKRTGKTGGLGARKLTVKVGFCLFVFRFIISYLRSICQFDICCPRHQISATIGPGREDTASNLIAACCPRQHMSRKNT
ncbi:ADP-RIBOSYLATION FACTOR GTPASE-ACTIVATING PROTEIN AGD9-RELATED [Salix viminalis]|uniref:ADP-RIBOSYLATION FACTOR GTPASE-ACTIVATING PROTEIN AGD9-RELATED n=1 Tax=Salix viminalis TaxID=40686 RepID=A0A9Q0QCI3_SALVM|nr:ADP-RIBOSYLATION FACTOR GTPASE-ACTIVATING PROTEIN AGD9-RELATED [Salix viminalis]